MFPTDDERNPYLQHEVYSAPPTRLRWLLIRRAEELCTVVEQLWRTEEQQQAGQWLLRLREILGELLSGVSQGDDPLRKTIADLYVFLIQQVQTLEDRQNYALLNQLREILSIEAETWRQAMDMQATGVSEPAAQTSASEKNYSSLSLEV